MDAFIGMIMPVGFNFAPRGWAFCNGQLIPIQQNSAMFALLGTIYGGDGQTTFGLPDLRGRVPVGAQGAGPGLTNIQQGDKGGSNSVTVSATGNVSVTLTEANLPAHTHAATGLAASTAVSVSTGNNGVVTPTAGSVLSGTSAGPASAAIYAPSATNPVSLGGISTSVSGSTASTGNGTALLAPVSTTAANVSVMQPYLGVNYVICMEGIFPSRN
jgi:microcystin-dependent protein